MRACVLNPSLQSRHHLSGLGEPAGGFLGVDFLSVQVDFEHPARALDETGRDVEAFFDLIRQTGGAGLVVSLDAVFDGDFMTHGVASFRRWNAEYTGR